MLQIGEHTVEHFRSLRTESLASRILSAVPALGSIEVARRYIAEALEKGLETERDIAEFTLILHPVDAAGRPPEIAALVRDERTAGPLKLFQIYYALHGERQ